MHLVSSPHLDCEERERKEDQRSEEMASYTTPMIFTAKIMQNNEYKYIYFVSADLYCGELGL